MPGEVAYAAAKATIAGVTLTLADHLRERTVNTGPIDTGCLTTEAWETASN